MSDEDYLKQVYKVPTPPEDDPLRDYEEWLWRGISKPGRLPIIIGGKTYHIPLG